MADEAKSMCEWLIFLRSGGVIERTAASYPKAVRHHKKITWVMLDKLEDAGLIVWSDFSHDSSKRHHIAKCKVLLTPAGELVASGRL